jgi:type I site-specific restriction-modification system R (restriction) subunit
LKIDFLKYHPFLNITRTESRATIFDPIRKKSVVLTPEEIVRQLVLQYLLIEKKYPAGRIRVEKGVKINGMTKRADLIVYDKNGLPWLLIECKSPKIEVNQDVFDQTARYNLSLKVPFLAITNGQISHCCAMNYAQSSWIFLEDFPDNLG